MKLQNLTHILIGIVCIGLLPIAQAVVPPPDGGYPNFNTAEGQKALFSLTSGSGNTAVGWFSLESVTTGSLNTATGAGSLLLNTIATGNTADGALALFSNSTGNENTANGGQALFSNTIGDHNVANGFQALYNNTQGFQNTATGCFALWSNTTGVANTADGHQALVNNTEGYWNTVAGNNGLFNSTGDLNTALGYAAADFTTGNNNIVIGNLGLAAESDTIRIGMEVAAMDEFGTNHPAHTATYIAGISGQTASGGVAVFVDANGKLGTLTSSGRFKTEIKPMDKASEAILALKPVTFRYKNEIDPEGIPQFGLVAEEVEKVNPDLVARDAKGKVYTVRYDAVNAMLLNEFLKEHRKVQEQGATIARLQKQIEALTAGLQKVSDQLEASKPAPQVVNNP